MGLSIKGKLWAQAGVVLGALVGTGCVAGLSSGVSAGAAQWIFGVLGGAGILAIVGTKLMINQTSAALEAATEAARRVARGDLTEDIRCERDDEIGLLMNALNETQSSMRRSVAQVRQSAESIQLASSEVAAGNQDLSGRTEQTASSLQQTSSSMEQLTGTVRQTADSARTANQLASSAAQAAQRGGDVVSQVVANMEEISASSRKIADIISVIDGIAFQTNILALNAAVEAARAGEQGRGFAVVATEVRNLAQRSANAAREIKTLIGASVEKVESGSRLVQDAGSTMTEIVSGVQRVTDIIGEITAAATEQSNELVQVNTAVTQLDQMTQQNAALVEQSAAAAESLKEQAVRLAGAVESFKLGQGSAPVAPRVALPVVTPVKPVHQSPKAVVGKAAPVKAATGSKPAAAAAKPAPVKPAAAAARHEPEAETEWTSF